MNSLPNTPPRPGQPEVAVRQAGPQIEEDHVHGRPEEEGAGEPGDLLPEEPLRGVVPGAVQEEDPRDHDEQGDADARADVQEDADAPVQGAEGMVVESQGGDMEPDHQEQGDASQRVQVQDPVVLLGHLLSFRDSLLLRSFPNMRWRRRVSLFLSRRGHGIQLLSYQWMA